MKNDGGDFNVYGYGLPEAGDYSFWDAIARNPSPLARDFWAIPRFNDIVAMTEVDADDTGEQEMAVMREVGGFDQALLIYNNMVPGDWTYWDSQGRNPLPLGRDYWAITQGNDTSLIADGGSNIATMRDQSGDYNLYLYDSPEPGDWNYWDAVSRNPSPLARDLWVIPQANDAAAMCGLDTTGDGDSDSILVVRNELGDYNVYLWNMPAAGDWSYADAIARNPSARARDFWAIPRRNDIAQVVGINRGASFDELGVVENYWGDYNFYIWNAPRPGDWTFGDAAARNLSPLARDFWVIPADNNTIAIVAPR